MLLPERRDLRFGLFPRASPESLEPSVQFSVFGGGLLLSVVVSFISLKFDL